MFRTAKWLTVCNMGTEIVILCNQNATFEYIKEVMKCCEEYFSLIWGCILIKWKYIDCLVNNVSFVVDNRNFILNRVAWIYLIFYLSSVNHTSQKNGNSLTFRNFPFRCSRARSHSLVPLFQCTIILTEGLAAKSAKRKSNVVENRSPLFIYTH